MEGLLKFCNKIIEYSFYALFFLVPLIFTNNTSELFELNKIWLTWSLSIIIIGAWLTKMTIKREFKIQRTIFDIPILLFLLSQIISTIFSLDQRISWWGYYSRFNGGLLSTLTYVALYYAFVSNLGKKEALRTLLVSLVSGLLVALWGLPSHFGYDPTCLLFRGSLDVSCWTDAFKPTIRIFSTLGQPAWMAAYLAILTPVAMAFSLKELSIKKNEDQKKNFFKPLTLAYLLLAVLFYLDLIFTNTRAGILGFWTANIFFWGAVFWKNFLPRQIFIRAFFLFNLSFLLLNFLFGTGFAQVDKFTLPGLRHTTTSSEKETSQATAPVGNLGGTDSGKIRLIVWDGAIEAWKQNPLFGTGVETFAFAYYLNRPSEHNLTSEWDYLYNKAHNEYLNYAATSGTFGILAYLSIFVLFFYIVLKEIILKRTKASTPSAHEVLLIALPASLISILVTNFFGFSVVIINLYLFLIPAIFLILSEKLNENKNLSYNFPNSNKTNNINSYQWTVISLVGIISLFLLSLLVRYWQADVSYALGTNLSRGGDIQGSYVKLNEAVRLRPSEPTIKDEYALILASLGSALIQTGDATNGAQLSQEAINLSDDVIKNHPNNITFWKNRVRIFYALAQIDPQYLSKALEAIQKTHELAPTDAKVMYNLGVLYGQNGNIEKATQTLSKAIEAKPDYRDAYYARALFYRELATESGTTVLKPELQEKAVADLQFILTNLAPQDEQARELLTSWGISN